MKRYGKIAITSLMLLLLCAAVWVAAVLVSPARAAETYTNTFMFRSSLTYPTVVFVEFPTGNVADLVTGIPALAETFEANDKTATQHAESDFWTIVTPPLASNKEWIICICDSSASDTAKETDTMSCYFYSPVVNRVVDADFASAGGGIFTRPTPTQ